MRGLRTSQVVTAFQEERAYPYSSYESEQAEDRIPIPTGQAEHSPPWASQKDQSSDHGKSAKHKPNNRSRARTCAEFLKRIGGNQRTKDKPDDFGPHILNNGRPMESQRTGNVPLETGHADTHICRIPPPLQKLGKDPNKS